MKKSMIFMIVLFVFVNTLVPFGASFKLTAVPALLNADTQINLGWNSVTNASYYSIYRDDVLLSTIDVDVKRNFLSYEDTDLLPETLYTYTVNAINSSEDIIISSSVTVSTLKMKSPSLVSWHLDINNNLISLSWLNNSLATKSIAIYKTDHDEMTRIENNGTYASFVDSSLVPDLANNYTLRSYDLLQNYADSYFKITSLQLPLIDAIIEKGVSVISWESNPHIEHFHLERSRYMEDSWGPWEMISTNIKKDSTQITDRLRDNGTYRYRLSVDNENYKGHSNISKPISRLFAPSNIQGIPITPGRIDLSWTNPPTGDFTLKIERREEGGSFPLISVVDSNITSYSDTYEIYSGKIYYYRIVASDSNNNTVSTPELRIVTGPPSPANSLTLDIANPTRIILNWQDNSNNESGFIVERRIGYGSFVEIASLPPNTTSYIDNTVNITSNYTYRVIPFNAFGKANSYTNEVLASTTQLRDPPASLIVTPISATQIDLSWTHPDYSNHSTAIERKTGANGNWEIITTLDTGYGSFSDTSLYPDTQYFYRVKTVIDTNIFSRPFPSDDIGIGAYTRLMTPKDLKSSWHSAGVVRLNWTGYSSSGSSLIIERKAQGSVFIPVGTTNSDELVWYDVGVHYNRDYTYRIKSINSYNSSDYSNESSLEALQLPSPESLQLTVLSDSQIMLNWKYDKSDITSFKVEQKIGTDGSWREIANLSNLNTSYTVKSLDTNTVYFYRVAAYSSSLNIKSYSDIVEVLLSTLKPPSNLIATTLSPIEIKLEWKDNSDNEQGFIIERLNNEGHYAEIARVGQNTQTYTDKNLSFNTLYYYRVRAYMENLLTSPSNAVTARTRTAITFNDISRVPWAKNAIENLASMEIIKGRNENIFAPNDIITRAEFISLVVNAFEIDKNPVGAFNDVAPNHWYYRNVIIAKNAGIVSGTGNNYFYPNHPIKREDMAVILARTLRITGNPLPHHEHSILDKFSDRHLVSDYSISSLSVLHGAGIINGKGNGLLAPRDFATRAEAAVILFFSISLLFEQTF
ncbi:UNVERIFIED_CONTAM: S-layer family protein [Acetivibrio alkalicellulosi]